jgi:hypothetical protein
MTVPEVEGRSLQLEKGHNKNLLEYCAVFSFGMIFTL